MSENQKNNPLKQDKEKGLYAWTAKVGSKGQIVIPKEAREVFDIKPNDTILLLGDINRGIALMNGEELVEKLLKERDI